MSIGTVFINNRTQAVRLPLDVRLPEGVHKVEVRAKGNERIIAPVGPSDPATAPIVLVLVMKTKMPDSR